MTYAQRIGYYGEYAAGRALMNNGYIVLEKNFKTKTGEVDIIAEHEDTIVFVEVKTRTNKNYAEPREFVTKEKQRSIITTALCFMKKYKIDMPMRFDVMEVIVSKETGIPTFTHIINAFDGNEYYKGY